MLNETITKVELEVHPQEFSPNPYIAICELVKKESSEEDKTWKVTFQSKDGEACSISITDLAKMIKIIFESEVLNAWTIRIAANENFEQDFYKGSNSTYEEILMNRITLGFGAKEE